MIPGISAVVSANQCFGFEFRPFITRTRAKLVSASDYARQVNKPTVVDLVGYGASDIRSEVGEKLVHNQPTVVKGNLSEMRTFASW